jgi:hypothetical protein
VDVDQPTATRLKPILAVPLTQRSVVAAGGHPHLQCSAV